MKSIAVTLAQNGASGWNEEIVKLNKGEETIRNIRETINKLTNLFNKDDDTTKALGPLTNKIISMFIKGLDRIDEPLTRLNSSLGDFNSDINSSITQTKYDIIDSYKLSPTTDNGWPIADTLYFYSQWERDHLGDPAFQLLWIGLYTDFHYFDQALKAAFDQDLMAVAFGGNISIGKVVLGIFVGWVEVANSYFLNIPSQSTGAEVTANYYRLDHIHTDIEIVQDSMNSHIADFQVWKAFSLRTRIEINLAGHGDHPHPIAIFQLPAKFGGYLELARDIVEETINDMLTAGENVYQAQLFLTRGNQEFLASHYKKAYDWYSKSYDEATK